MKYLELLLAIEGVNHKMVASLMGVNVTTVYRWINGERKISPMAERLLYYVWENIADLRSDYHLGLRFDN